MRNLIVDEDTCRRSDVARRDSAGGSSSDNVRTARRRCEIVDLRRALQGKISSNEIFCGLEIVSASRPSGFYQRLLEEMGKYSPLFYALTWHEEAPADTENYLPLNLLENFPSNTLLHLAAKSFKRDEVIRISRKALALGTINVFALRGDSLSEDGDFKHAADLVAFIREQFGGTFCICVAGYPQMHPESPSRELDLLYLKAKVDAGADFIITQICFESQAIIDFVNDCRKIGIRVPIVLGIFVPMSYECLERMASICKLDVPVKIKDDLSRVRDNDEAVTKFAVDLAMQIMTDVIRSGVTRGFHLFTLNRLPLVAEIYRRIEFLKTEFGN
ncbi:Methylenetetrahydrofolate reductase [Ooceraea biroi]|uniref:Methylenetetrahydrofolate reductase n=1 Tax=Ooceraea biroi TaxID=2015173 RepID=A0A026X227_OOCBI|nr:Methylenetetrahydrofolate reductase [Ooceraea biroi]